MPVTVTHDGTNWRDGPAEACACCSRLTRYWLEPKDVALCPRCASGVSEDHVPSKAEWCAGARAIRAKSTNV